MLEKSLGDLFREYRVAKGFQISDIESQTGIGAQHLLAIELDQFRLLPQDKTEEFVARYAELVGLPFSLINEKSNLKLSLSETGSEQEASANEEFSDVVMTVPNVRDEDIVSSQVASEVVSVPLFETANLIESELPVIPNVLAETEDFSAEDEKIREGNHQDDLGVSSIDNSILEFETEVALTDEDILALETELFEEPLALDNSEERLSTVAVSETTSQTTFSRLNKEQDEAKPKKKSYFGLGLLSLAALAVLGFVGYTFYQQFMGNTEQASTSETTTTMTQSEEATTTQTTIAETTTNATIRTEGGGEYLTAYLPQTTTPVEVKFELTNTAGESWVSLTDDYAGEVGSLLNATTPSYTTKLTTGASRSVLTIGITPDVKVTINGQELDTSALTTTGISYVTLVVE